MSGLYESSGSASGTNKWIIAVTVILGTYVAVIDVTIVNVAMPQMMGTFGVSLDAVTWVAVSYSIAEIVMVTMAFWFTRLMGRKNFYIACIVLFTVASVFSGMARSLEMIIITRTLQGLGGGALIPMAQAILLETFPEEEHRTAMAVFMVGVVMAPAMGPVLGGVVNRSLWLALDLLHQYTSRGSQSLSRDDVLARIPVPATWIGQD